MRGETLAAVVVVVEGKTVVLVVVVEAAEAEVPHEASARPITPKARHFLFTIIQIS